jgi:hypothetical protein
MLTFLKKSLSRDFSPMALPKYNNTETRSQSISLMNVNVILFLIFFLWAIFPLSFFIFHYVGYCKNIWQHLDSSLIISLLRVPSPVWTQEADLANNSLLSPERIEHFSWGIYSNQFYLDFSISFPFSKFKCHSQQLFLKVRFEFVEVFSKIKWNF